MVLWYNTKEYEVTNIIHICNLKVLMWKDLHKILVPLSSGYPCLFKCSSLFPFVLTNIVTVKICNKNSKSHYNNTVSPLKYFLVPKEIA